jgi:hypothetical protein
MDKVFVDVKSAWIQPTNIASAAGLIVMVGTLTRINVDQHTAEALIVGASAAVHLFVIIRRTWFTKTITPMVAKKL